MIVTFIHPAAMVCPELLHRAAAVLQKDSSDMSTELEEWSALLKCAPMDLHFPVAAAAVPSERHRQKHLGPLFNACVARSVGPKEVKTNKEAQKAMKAEWTRLRAVDRRDGKKGCWDEDCVMEWQEVKRLAGLAGKKAHVGRVFGICVEKNHELPEGDKRRKYKGRAVFGGDNVRDERGDWAIFQDLGSCPATMEAARAGDAYGCYPNHGAEQ